MGLRIIHQDGQAYDLAGEITVGRDIGCTISLPTDAGVSRRHARFLWLQGLPMVEDLGSSNGTFLNGARVTQARPVSSGDEVRMGSATFRVEAVMDGIAAPPTPAPQPMVGSKEVSRGEGRGRGNRKAESSGVAEGSLYGDHGANEPLKGCALPSVDLSGCMKYLWILLLILIAAVILGLIIFGVGALITAAGGVGSSVSGVGGGGSGSAGSGSPPDGNQPTPPPTNAPPANQPPQQPQDNPPQQAPGVEGILVREVKVDFDRRGGSQLKPVVLLRWLNLTKNPVKRLFGTVYLYDRDGKLIVEIPRERLYDGPPIGPAEEHGDTLKENGVVIQRELSRPPVTAKVRVEKFE